MSQRLRYILGTSTLAILLAGGSYFYGNFRKSIKPRPDLTSHPISMATPQRTTSNELSSGHIDLWMSSFQNSSKNPKKKYELLKSLNVFLDKNGAPDSSFLPSLQDLLFKETFHEFSFERKTSILAANILTKLPPPNSKIQALWLQQIEKVMTQKMRPDQIYIWLQMASEWVPFPALLQNKFKINFSKKEHVQDNMWTLERIKDPQAKKELIAEYLKLINNLPKPYQKIVQQRFHN